MQVILFNFNINDKKVGWNILHICYKKPTGVQKKRFKSKAGCWVRCKPYWSLKSSQTKENIKENCEEIVINDSKQRASSLCDKASVESHEEIKSILSILHLTPKHHSPLLVITKREVKLLQHRSPIISRMYQAFQVQHLFFFF